MNGHCLLILLFSVISASASEAQDVASHQATASANKEIVRRFYGDVFGRWNLALVDTVIAPTFIGHDMPSGTPPGPDGFRAFYARLRTSFPDLRYTVEDMVAEGDRVVVRWRWDATHSGPFLGIPATGKPAPTTGIAIYRLQAGQIVERWVSLDLLGLTRRLGATLVPPKG